MPVTKEQLDSQLASLQSQEQEHMGDLLATRGAIQFCLALLALETKEPDNVLPLLHAGALSAVVTQPPKGK